MRSLVRMAAMRSFARMARVIAMLALASSVSTGCAKVGAQPAPLAQSAKPARPAPASVNVSALVATYPFNGLLTQYDREIAALRSTEATPGLNDESATFDRDTATLRSELDQTAVRLANLSSHRAQAYEQREGAATAALLSEVSSAASRQPASARVQQEYRREYAALHGHATTDLERYRDAVLAQERAALTALEQAIVGRAQRAYSARAQQLDEKEAALDMDVARAEAGKRLSLRVRLQDLVLAKGDRTRLQGELNGLYRSQAKAVSEQHQRDTATLSAFRSRLDARARDTYARAAEELHARALTDMGAAARVFRVQMEATRGSPEDVVRPSSGESSMRPKVEQLRAADRGGLRENVSATAAAFGGARNGIVARFAQLRAQDAAARRGIDAQIAALERDRLELRGEIVETIMRDAERVARSRGFSAVYPADRAPRGSVDLTTTVRAELAKI